MNELYTKLDDFKKVCIHDHDGRQITPLENVFIQEYMISKNASEAVQKAGYRSKNPAQQVCTA